MTREVIKLNLKKKESPLKETAVAILAEKSGGLHFSKLVWRTLMLTVDLDRKTVIEFR
jgi:hypothetical protein